jgi:hypothetical protein
MRFRHCLFLILATLVLLTGVVAEATPSYRSFIEWNGPYYHVRHGLNSDSSAYVNYTVNNPLPLYSTPFSSPNAVVLYGTPVSLTAFVLDHDHRRIQAFNTNVGWNTEQLGYSSTPVQGNYGLRWVKCSLGQVLPGSERIFVNGRPFTRVNSLTGYTTTDSVYTIEYNGVPNAGGVATLPNGWSLGVFDSVRVEYAFATPPGTTGAGDVDYLLYQSVPTDIPLQLHEATSATDPDMSDLTSFAINPSMRSNMVLDLYLVNALPGGAGTLSSYELSGLGTGGVFNHVDTYPGLMGRPYDVEVVDRAANIAGDLDEGIPSNASNTRIAEAVINHNTFLGHDYRLTFSFDTSSTMNQSDTPDNRESDVVFDPIRGRLHMVFCRDNATEGTAYSYSDDYGQTWSEALTISPATLTANHDRPRVAVRTTGEIHVVYEAINGGGERHLYHIYSADGVTWSPTLELTTALTPSTVTENRYATLLVDPNTNNVHLIWAGDDDVYHRIYTTSWGSATLVATGAGSGYSAPHAVMDNVGRIYMAFVSNAVPPCEIGYMHYNGAVWGSYDGGGFTSGTVDPVTTASGVLSVGASSWGEVFPFPQIVLTGDSIWIFWVGQGTEGYGTDPTDIYYSNVSSLDGDFAPTSGNLATTGDVAAPMSFSVTSDANHNLYLVWPFATTEDEEGFRFKTWTASTDTWAPLATTTGRTIFAADVDATTFAIEPRLIVPSIAGQAVPMLACTKAYTALGAGSPRIMFKIIDGVLTITDQTTLTQFNQFRVWRSGEIDLSAIPGTALGISNTSDAISNTDDVDGTEFNVGDYFELDGTPAEKNDLLFVTDSDRHRVKIIRAYDNIDNCFGGDTRWEVPGLSNGTPSQTYKLATTGSENSYRVWASPDSAAWTVVDNLLIAGPTDRYCEINRYTHELRFGDNAHGLIPPAGTFIRVQYQESVDEAEFGSQGSGDGQMSYPHGMAVAYNAGLGQYDIYTCDVGNNRLQKWAYRPNASIDPAFWTNPVVSWNTASGDSDLLSAPEDIEVVTLNGSVYLVVSDNGNARVIVYRDVAAMGSGGNAAPVYVSTVGSRGNNLNEFMDPRGMAVMAEDSGLVIFAADAERNEVTKIVTRDWLTMGEQDTSGGGGQSTNVPTLFCTDALDGDGCLLMQPGAIRTIELRIGRSDSLVALRAYANFPAAMIDILSVSEGNLWSGERFTNKVFLYSYDNATGRMEVNAAMVGDDDGLSNSGSRVIATFVVRCDSAMVSPSSGSLVFTDSTDLRKVGNYRIVNYNRTAFSLRGGLLGDIASVSGNSGTPPAMVPQPDGRVNFADVNAFTQGWNGDGLDFDPIADIGPYTGTTVPNLIANPDGHLDAYDLLALSTMYNWYNGSNLIQPPLPPMHDHRSLDAGSPLVAAARQTEQGWTIELQARDITALTTAHLYLDLSDVGGTITAVRAGSFMGDGSTLFLNRIQGASADICLGRLNREQPFVSGSGVLAEVDVTIPSNVSPDMLLQYELRDNHNTIIIQGQANHTDLQSIPASFSLESPYPNPFNAVTTFTLNLSDAGRTSLRVYNTLGQQVAEIMNREMPAGVHHLTWEARGDNGMALPSGLYVARLETPGKASVRKIVLLR